MVGSIQPHAVADLGPWFHNLHLPGGIETCPEHWAGDFPRWKWLEVEGHIPADLTEWRVLDIGCNAGFYSFEFAKRGAEVLGIDIDPHYLAQASWAAEQFGLKNVQFARRELYELDTSRALRSDRLHGSLLPPALPSAGARPARATATAAVCLPDPHPGVDRSLRPSGAGLRLRHPGPPGASRLAPSCFHRDHAFAAIRPIGGCPIAPRSWACCEAPDSTSSLSPATRRGSVPALRSHQESLARPDWMPFRLLRGGLAPKETCK